MTEPAPGSVLGRLHRVEVGLEVQAEILTNIQEMLLEADRLTDSIGRLGEGAGSLSAALLQVDSQQKLLTRLDEDLQQVKDQAATTEDVEAKVAAAKELVDAKQKATRRKIALWLLATLLVTVVVGYFGVQYVHRVQATNIATCERQQRTNAAVVEYLQTVADNSQNAEIKRSAQDLINSLPASAQVKPCS